jgi:coenzyme F420-reducing hydrogenase alpha subunit
MSSRIVVDPITRIEGHLRIEAQMEGNQIGQAYSSGTMVRGIEMASRSFCRGAIRAMHGRLRNASAACAHLCTVWHRSVPLKMRWGQRFRRTPS